MNTTLLCPPAGVAEVTRQLAAPKPADALSDVGRGSLFSRWFMPAMAAVMDRRLLINFRVAPDVLAALLPRPFRPQLVRGWGLAGICLLRLRDARPLGLPAFVGLNSENAAHRIAVEWNDADGRARTGVFIPRRDTASRLNRLVGGRLFPGVHHAATFTVREPGNRFKVAMRSADGVASLRVHGHLATEWPAGSVFASLAEASDFFARGSLGWSPTADGGACEGLELRSREWRMDALTVDWVESSFFADTTRFPAGSWKFDSALVMRGIPCEWRAGGILCGVIPENGRCV